MNELLEKTFSNKVDLLPTISEINIEFDQDYNFDEVMKTINIRSDYIRNSFCILSHEFISEIVNLFKKLKVKSITELGSGCGWLTYWIKKYGFLNINAIDDYSWIDERHWDVLKLVENHDSVEYVRDHNDIELFILSWPYMDDVATNIWNEMKEGQYLLYIGESNGGCTADEKFFELTDEHEIKNGCTLDLMNSFRSFWGIHDLPVLFLKGYDIG